MAASATGLAVDRGAGATGAASLAASSTGAVGNDAATGRNGGVSSDGDRRALADKRHPRIGCQSQTAKSGGAGSGDNIGTGFEDEIKRAGKAAETGVGAR